jgi:ABC-type transport system substrate-binding protein
VAVQNLTDCGFQIIPLFTPASWWFGDTTGLARRDFELGAFAWVGQADPQSGMQLYQCNQIPLPSNGWEGQNYMGWCNQEASEAAVIGNFSLDRDTRVTAYDTLQQHFAEDMISLPLFQRAEAEAWSLSLEGLRVDETEYGSASAAQWTLADGGDTIVLGYTQEPASMFTLVESAAVQAQIAQIGVGVGNTQYSYDYQPVLQTELSTLDAGLATNEMVPVAAGDMVWTANSEPEELAAGTRLIMEGEVLEFDGTSEMQLPQLKVTYRLNDYTWSDGTPGSIEDVKLAYQTNCDRESGATTFVTCDSIAGVEYSDSALEWTVTYLPGVQDPLYYLAPWTISPNSVVYPSHQVLSDGRALKDVPAREWTTLPEIAEKPLSYGPFMITEWQKGQSLTMEANPYYAPGTGVQQIIVIFISDTNQAVAQLLNGDVDYLEKATLGGGAEVQTVVDAAAEGKVNLEILPSPTWEHIDMNLFTK